MAIVSCSLTCSDSGSNPGGQILCGVTDVFENQEIRLTFSAPIKPVTVSNTTFQLQERSSGITPAGILLVDPGDPRVLIYRPQLTFDSSGNPIFGLARGREYLFTVPGTAVERLGPHIQSLVGSPNRSHLACTLVASQGVNDAKPGRPRVAVTVDRVSAYDAQGNPIAFELNVTAQDATDVFRGSPLRMTFDDVMNPATLANPVTGLSGTIRVFVDANGDIATRDDWVPVGGSFALLIDQNALRTTVVFSPSGGLPSAGSNAQRRVVLELSPQIADLAGGALLNPGIISFTSEVIAFGQLDLTEPFSDAGQQDATHSSSGWGGGLLAPGLGGGSGRLGELIVPPGALVELDTDSEDFASIDDEVIFNPTNVIDRTANFQVTGGVFEFTRLRVDSGGVLRFKGSRAGRLLIRGQAAIQGLVDVAGRSGQLQRSDADVGGAGGQSGAGGGDGGRGGYRPDGSAFVSVGGVANPGAGPTNVQDPGTYVLVNGDSGTGIPVPSTIDPAPVLIGAGEGALAWPQPTAANAALHMPQNPADTSGLQAERLQLCSVIQPAAPGGGGAHGLSGGTGVAVVSGVASLGITLAPNAPGGRSEDIGVDDLARSLAPELGLLRGGAGGGGGGGHIQLTRVNGQPLGSCSIPVSGALQVNSYLSHSGGGGGGGGGGLQLAAGLRIDLDGVIDVSGGDGGSSTFPPNPSSPSDLAVGGGGGAGGGLLLQSQIVQIRGIPGRIDFSGGEGGEGSGNPAFPVRPSFGGHGGAGLLRMETLVPISIEDERFKVLPSEEDLQAIHGPATQIEDVFTTATWTASTEGASAWSGAQSCWIRPSGSFFSLNFLEDQGGQLGWDMRLRIAGEAVPQSYRGENDLFPGATLEQVFGADIGTAPVIVRFQGARAVGVLNDPCSVPESDSSQIATGSLTDWVRHPSELNDFFPGEASLSPNMIRFSVLWDRSQPEAAQIEGIDDLTISIQPD
jgi:hypothetical protein